MASWWQKKQVEAEPAPTATEPEEDEDWNAPPAWAEGAGDVEDDDDDEPEPETESRLEKALRERVQVLRDKLNTQGVDISDDGEMVIRDPKRFRDWARPAVGVAAGDPPPPQRPAAVAAPEPNPEPEPKRVGQDKEIWELTPDEFDDRVRREAEKMIKPYVDQLNQQRTLVGKKYVDDAMEKASDALQSVAPEMMYILDHPQFEDVYRQHLNNLPPEWLDNQQVLASTALGALAWLDKDEMPEPRNPINDQAARAAVNRASVRETRPALDQSSAAVERGYPDEYQRGSRWLADKRIARIAPEELMALDATDERGMHTIEAYMKARKRTDKGKAKSR